MSEELDRHLSEWHTYDKGAVAEMVAEHNAMMEVMPDISMMIDDFYGDRHPIVGDPNNRDGGRLEKYDAFMANGGMRFKIPAGGWVAIAALITTLGIIAVAVINIAFGSPV